MSAATSVAVIPTEATLSLYWTVRFAVSFETDGGRLFTTKSKLVATGSTPSAAKRIVTFS
jgi:hypothetical protein